jgi:O-antigen/teichoic acid export membrane protein
MTEESKDTGSLSRVALRGTGWHFISFFGGRALSFLSTVILARLLLKDDFGLVGYAVTFISFLEVMSTFGVNLAVIYHKESDENSTASFWLSMLVGVTLFSVTFVAAPFVGEFFKDTRVVPIVRALGGNFLFYALSNTHGALLRKKLAFGQSIIADMTGSVFKAIVSITLAFMDYGPWSLVLGQLAGNAVATIIYWIILPWRPSFKIDFSAARSLLSYGVRSMSVDFVSILSSNIDYVLIGRYLNAEALGVYTLAFRLPELLIGGVARVISNVVFPLFAHIKSTQGDLSKGVYMITQYVSLVTIPLGIGLALVARPLTLVIFTDKWLDLVPIMQAIAIYSTLSTLDYYVGTLFKAEGAPQLLTWLGLIHIGLLIPFFIWAVVFEKSVLLVAWSHTLVQFIISFLTVYIATKRSTVTWRGMFTALRPSFLAVLPMIIVVIFVMRISEDLNIYLHLGFAIVSGAITYATILWFTQRELLLDVYSRVVKAIVK